MTDTPMFDAVIFDVGDVLTRPGHLMLDRLEAAIGRRIVGRGPFGPEPDPRWERRVAGQMSSAEYWNGLAADAGVATWRALYGLIAHHFPDDMFDPDMVQLVRDAKAAGRRAGVLTNDMVAISGPGFAAANPTMQLFDAVIDATELGVRKPDGRSYAAICDVLDVPPERAVFLDDTPACIDGAERFGMRGVLVDTFDRAPALAEVRKLLAA